MASSSRLLPKLKLVRQVNRSISRLSHSDVNSFESRRVVVTGIGTVTPLGTDTNSAFEDLLKKRSCTKHITKEMNEEDEKFGDIYSRLSSQVAARVPLIEFDNKKKDCIKSSDLRSMSRAMSMGIVASVEALKDSNWIPKGDNLLARTGVAIGNAMVDLDYISESHDLLTGNTKGNKVLAK